MFSDFSAILTFPDVEDSRCYDKRFTTNEKPRSVLLPPPNKRIPGYIYLPQLKPIPLYRSLAHLGNPGLPPLEPEPCNTIVLQQPAVQVQPAIDTIDVQSLFDPELYHNTIVLQQPAVEVQPAVETIQVQTPDQTEEASSPLIVIDVETEIDQPQPKPIPAQPVDHHVAAPAAPRANRRRIIMKNEYVQQFSDEEREYLMKLYMEFQDSRKKWSLIQKHFPNYTKVQIKNEVQRLLKSFE